MYTFVRMDICTYGYGWLYVCMFICSTRVNQIKSQPIEIRIWSCCRFRMLQSGSLEFNAVKPTDTGNYTCVADNSAGTANKSLALRYTV